MADSLKKADGSLLYALELYHNDGPFTHPDDYKKITQNQMVNILSDIL